MFRSGTGPPQRIRAVALGLRAATRAPSKGARRMSFLSNLPGMTKDIGTQVQQAAKGDPDPYGGGTPFIPPEIAEDLNDPWMAGGGPLYGSASASVGDLFD